LRDERREAPCVEAALADDDRDVLLAVDRVGDRARARYVVQPRLPQRFSRALVVRAEEPVERRGEHEPARGREHAGGLRRTLPGRPERLAGPEIDRLEAAVEPVAVGPRADAPVHAGRKPAAAAA